MALRSSVKRSTATVRMDRLGRGGLDMESHPQKLDVDQLALAEYVRTQDRSLSRAPGERKVERVFNPGGDGSWEFGLGNYAQIVGASQLLVPVGGFVLRLAVKASRPSGGNTAHILATRVNGKAYGPFSVTLSDAGVLTVGWRKESDESAVSHAASAVADGAPVNLMLVYDPHTSSGRSLLYVDGDLEDTVTGVGATEQPMQDAVDWYVGAEYDPAAPGIVANTEFDGGVDALCLLSTAGARVSDGTPSMLSTLRTWALSEWPDPAGSMVLAWYGFDESSGSTLVDSSRFKNDGTLTGSPTSAVAITHARAPGNHLGVLQRADGRRLLVAGIDGGLYAQDVRLAQ